MTSHAAAAQQLGQGQAVGPSLLSVVAALFLCLGLGVAAIVAIRMRLGLPLSFVPIPNRRLRLIEAIRIGGQTSICIIAIDDREIVCAVDPRGVTVIDAPPHLSVAE